MPRYQKVLVLLDLSDHSERVFTAGRDMAAYTDASIVALHVVDFMPAEPMAESLMPAMQIEQELAQRSHQRLQEFITRFDVERRASCRVEIGNTKAEILRVAEEEGADLIVVGSHERHGLAILINFTEDTVLHAAHCDVLAVRLS
jgi:universal stress protein A